MRLGPPDHAAATHHRVVAAAAALLADGGPEAVSTRAVSAAAHVQAPTIYRLFGDKRGLLDAVATEGFEAYVDQHASSVPAPCADPVDGLRRGWDGHVSFGLAHPHLYALVYGRPRPGEPHPVAVRAAAILAKRVQRVAEAGRLALPVQDAVLLIQAAGCGTTLTLIGQPEGARDLALSDRAREAVIAATTTDVGSVEEPGAVGAALHLRAVLGHTHTLSDTEQALLRDWLDRIASGPTSHR